MAQKILGNQFLDPQLPYLFFPKHELPNDTPAGNTYATSLANLSSIKFLAFYKRKAFFSPILL